MENLPPSQLNFTPLYEMLQYYNIKQNLSPFDTYQNLQKKKNSLPDNKNKVKNYTCLSFIELIYFKIREPNEYISFNYLQEEDKKQVISLYNIISQNIIRWLKDKNLGDPLLYKLNNKVEELYNILQFNDLFKQILNFLPIDPFPTTFVMHFQTVLLSLQDEYSLSFQYYKTQNIDIEVLQCPILSFDSLDLLKEVITNLSLNAKKLIKKEKTLSTFAQDIIEKIESLFYAKDFSSSKYAYLIIEIIRSFELFLYIQNYKENENLSLIELENLTETQNKTEQKDIAISSSEEIEKTNSKVEQNKKNITTKMNLLLSNCTNVEDILTLLKTIVQQNDEMLQKNDEMVQQNKKLLEKVEKIERENKYILDDIKRKNTENVLLKNQCLFQKSEMNVQANQIKNLSNTVKNKESKIQQEQKVINTLNETIDKLKLDLVLLSKRGYLKIIIEFCRVLSKIRSKKIFLKRYEIEQMIEKFRGIKRQFDLKAHTTPRKYGINDTDETETVSIFQQIKKILYT